MTKNEIKKALREIENKKSELEEQLRQLEEESENFCDPLSASLMNAKNAARKSLTSGNMKKLFDNILNNIDYIKIAVKSFANIAEKAQDKLEGRVEEITVSSGMAVMTNMWIPMILALIQTQEFQHLMANMVATAIQES
jgi:hypothetical protein